MKLFFVLRIFNVRQLITEGSVCIFCTGAPEFLAAQLTQEIIVAPFKFVSQ